MSTNKLYAHLWTSSRCSRTRPGEMVESFCPMSKTFISPSPRTQRRIINTQTDHSPPPWVKQTLPGDLASSHWSRVCQFWWRSQLTFSEPSWCLQAQAKRQNRGDTDNCGTCSRHFLQFTNLLWVTRQEVSSLDNRPEPKARSYLQMTPAGKREISFLKHSVTCYITHTPVLYPELIGQYKMDFIYGKGVLYPFICVGTFSYWLLVLFGFSFFIWTDL